MMSDTLVTVICLCHNQNKFVAEAIQSVFLQTHTKIQLIVVDDASTDGSKETIRQILLPHPTLLIIDLPQNVGSCKAFNKALPYVQGEFVIDLAADDVLLPNCIETGLIGFANQPANMGVHFTDAEHITESGLHAGYHSDRFPHGSIPQGYIYQHIVKRYFVCASTMLFRKSVIDELGGYDEALSYEDFDFCVRASRHWQFRYTPTVTIKKRKVSNSLGSQQFTLRSRHQQSTFKVCEKIALLNRSRAEQQALYNRIRYELRLNLSLLNIELCWRYFLLLLASRKKIMPV
jgi:GT2 family glycosyltransferase